MLTDKICVPDRVSEVVEQGMLELNLWRFIEELFPRSVAVVGALQRQEAMWQKILDPEASDEKQCDAKQTLKDMIKFH
jgi:hypothetical protein